RIGLITEVAADDALQSRAEEIAEQLVELPTQALSASKRLVWSGVGASVEQRLAEEARTVSELSGTADALEGLRAVIERRPPRFERGRRHLSSFALTRRVRCSPRSVARWR